MTPRALALSVAMLAVASSARAQSEPYEVFDTRPVISEGPYMVATSETTATIVSLTDTPSQDQVARVDATSTELNVVVTGTDGSVVHTLAIPRR